MLSNRAMITHRKAHRADNLKQSWNVDRLDEQQVPFPYWTEKALSGRCIKQFWRGEPPKLIDPSPVYNFVFKMLDAGVRIPKPFSYYGWVPMQHLWSELGQQHREFVRDPYNEEREELQQIFLTQALKERKEDGPSAAMKAMIGSGALVTTGVQTEVAWKDVKYFAAEVNNLMKMRDLESEQQ